MNWARVMEATMNWATELMRRVLPKNRHTPDQHLLHRYKGERGWCEECGSSDMYSELHLRPCGRVLTILDGMKWPRYLDGSLASLAAGVFSVDDAAVVYMAEKRMGTVFIELSDPALRGRVAESANHYRPAGVLL
jgi:hypothetical protein